MLVPSTHVGSTLDSSASWRVNKRSSFRNKYEISSISMAEWNVQVDKYAFMFQVTSLSSSQSITHVAVSDGATTVCTKEGVYVLHEYQCRKIASKYFHFPSDFLTRNMSSSWLFAIAFVAGNWNWKKSSWLAEIWTPTLIQIYLPIVEESSRLTVFFAREISKSAKLYLLGITFQVVLLTKDGKIYVWSQNRPIITR